jgi:hypothetical protein
VSGITSYLGQLGFAVNEAVTPGWHGRPVRYAAATHAGGSAAVQGSAAIRLQMEPRWRKYFANSPMNSAQGDDGLRADGLAGGGVRKVT